MSILFLPFYIFQWKEQANSVLIKLKGNILTQREEIDRSCKKKSMKNDHFIVR